MARKNRKKRPEGLDPQEARRQRLEARRIAKEQALAEKRRREKRARLIRLVALAAVGVALFWFVFLRGRGPGEINGNPIETLSTAGSGLHTSGDVSYESAPPVSGEHRQGAPGCGTYAQQLEDELQVHALEHGAVGIQYAPDLDPEQIEGIEKFVGGFEKDVFSAPYEGMQTPVTVTSWGKKMQLESFEEDTASEYVDTFAGGGPEGATNDCDNTESASFTPAGEVTPSPLESLSPEPSPEDKPKGKPEDKATASP